MFETVIRCARRAVGLGGEDDPYRGVVRRLAETLHRQERVAGGWATEVGVLPPEAFEDEAERMVRSIALGHDQDGTPAP
ncbi:MAG: hypothetical protein M3O34_09575 [Chloroflexota bacterium]|nr:hypothetical protein [Chloroflexota bacterium]